MKTQHAFEEANDPLLRIRRVAAILGALLLLAAAFGCSGAPRSPATGTPSPAKVTTPELVRGLKQQNADFKNHLDALFAKINAIPDAVPEKQAVLDYFQPLPIDWSKMNMTLGSTEKSVGEDAAHTQAVEKKNAALEANDPARTEFRNYGIGAVLLGTIGLVASFFAASIPLIGPFLTMLGELLRWGSVVLMGIGFFLITIARFLSTIEDILFWTGVAALAGVLALIVVKLAKSHWQIADLVNASDKPAALPAPMSG